MSIRSLSPFSDITQNEESVCKENRQWCRFGQLVENSMQVSQGMFPPYSTPIPGRFEEQFARARLIRQWTCPENVASLEAIAYFAGPLEEIPPQIGQLTALRELNFSDKQVRVLPREIGQLTNLEGLILSGHRLTELPPEIGQLTKLKCLCLSDGTLTALPREIGQLTNLEMLKLSNNQLTTLPVEVASLPKLKSLAVKGNDLEEATVAMLRGTGIKVKGLQKKIRTTDGGEMKVGYLDLTDIKQKPLTLIPEPPST